MRYIEVTVNTPPDEIELRCQQMADMGAEGFVIESEEDLRDFLENNRQYWDYVDEALEESFKGLSRIKCYLTDDDAGRLVLKKIRQSYEGVMTAPVQDSDWENNWRQYYKPIETGKKLVVVPEWESAPDCSRAALRLDPGLIFGTGSHATTRMCLEALEAFSGPGVKVLDLGCGSGILGIGALILGCDSCVSVDVDPKAPDVVKANAALNDIGPDRLRALAGDIIADAALRRELGAGYDMVLANIVADVIIPLSGMVEQFMAPGAVFICSGIIDHRRGDTEAVLSANGFAIERRLSMEEWHCFVCRRICS